MPAVAGLFLAGAIVAEICATVCLKLSDGLARPGYTAAMIAGYVLSLALLAQTLKTMDVSVAYAIWAGVGTAAITAIGIVAFSEPLTAMKLAGAALVIVGVVALNLEGAH